MNSKIVMIRHGESLWNKENRFTGWVDVDLSPAGLEEAKKAGELLKTQGYDFDVCYTSVLRRAIRTAWTVLTELDRMWLPTFPEWRLNERHYGALQGLNKSETAARYGEEQIFKWRRSYDTLPPLLGAKDPQHPSHDPRYRNVPQNELPGGEALKQTLERVLPLWEKKIYPDLKSGKRILIAAHGNSLRALVKHLDQMSDDAISAFNIPTAVPLVYEFDSNFRRIDRYYLGDAQEIEKKAHAVASQGKKA